MQRDNRSRDPEGSRRRWYESRDRDPRDQDQGDSRQQTPRALPPHQPLPQPQYQQQPFSPGYQQTPPPRQYDPRYDQSPMYQQSPQYPRFPAPPQQYHQQQPHPYPNAPPQSMPAYNDPRQSQQTPQRPQTPSSVFSSSSDTSTSLLDISRFKDTKQFGGVFGTFFKAPSDRVKQRLHRKKQKKRRVLYFGNSSSSSVNSDLAYGYGYVKQPKSRTLSPRSQSRASGQTHGSVSGQGPSNGHRRRSSGGSDRASRPVPRKKTADEEIMALGQQLSDLARRSKEDEQRISSRGSGKGKAAALGLAAGAAGVAMGSRFGKQKQSPKGKGKSKHRVDTSDDGSEWEDASDDEGTSSSDDAASAGDSELAYGTVGESIKPAVGVAAAVGGAAAAAAMADSRRHSGYSQSSEYRRFEDRGSIVDPRLFGPYNSLRGSINTPCGFRDEGQAEAYRRDSGNFVFGSPIQMRDSYPGPPGPPGPAPGHNRFGSAQFSASGPQQESKESTPRPAPGPVSGPASGHNRFGSAQFSASGPQQDSSPRRAHGPASGPVFGPAPGHNRFGSAQFSASGPHQDSSSRPAAVPLQQPVPKLPVSSKVYETEKYEDVNGKESRQRKQEHSNGKSWSGVAAAGLAAAAASAALASSSRKDSREHHDEKRFDRDSRDRREQERIDMERQKALEVEQQKLNELERQKARELERYKNQNPGRQYDDWEQWHKSLEHERERNAKWERDYRETEPAAVIPNYNNDRKSSRHNDHDDTPTERKEKKEKQKYDIVVEPQRDQGKGGAFRIEHGQEFKVMNEPVVQAESSQRNDTRDGRDLPLPTGAGHQAITKPTESDPDFVNPFQYQVADDAFTLSQRTTPRRPLTPNVVTVDREPNFDDSPPRTSAADARLSRRDSFEIERMVEDYHRDSQDVPQQRKPQTGREYEQEEREAKSILDEAKKATIPVAAVAVASAVAVEHERSKEKRKSKSSKGKSQKNSRGRKDVVQEEADRYYRESCIARKIASEEMRSRSASPEPSVVDKWQDDKNESFTIVTPPAMEDKHAEKSIYEGPDADVKIDNKIYPQEERRFRNLGDNSSALVLRQRDISRERPVLNLIYPTPAASRQPTPAPPARKQEKEESFDAEDVIIGPKGEILPASEPVSVAKSVSWGENETKRFDAHTPEARSETENYFPKDKSPDKPRPKLNKASRWGILAAALAGSSAEPHNEPDVEVPSKQSDISRNFPDDTSRDVVVQRAEAYGDDASREPPVPGPKPASPHRGQMPGGYADDLEFAATLAAGLKDTGFNPDIVIEDPSYSRRDSPPGVQEANGDSHGGTNGNSWYKRPYVDPVPEMNDPNVPKLLPEQGFVLGEVETPQEKTFTPYRSERDIKPELPKPEDVPLPDNGPDNTKLSKREQRKRDKSDVVVVQDDGKIENVRAEPSPAREAVEEVWEDTTRKKGKKKDRKSRDLEDDSSSRTPAPFDYNTTPSRDLPARDSRSYSDWSAPRDEDRSRDFSAADIAKVAVPALALGALASSSSRDTPSRDVHSDDERDTPKKSRKQLNEDDYYDDDRSRISSAKPSHHGHSSRDVSSRDVQPDDEFDESKHSRKHKKDRESRDDKYRDYANLDPVDRRSSRRDGSRDRSRDRSRHHSRERSRHRSRDRSRDHRSRDHRSRDRTRDKSRDRSRHRRSDDEEERPKSSKRHPYGYDSPSRSLAASEISLGSTSSRRSKKSKRRSGNEDDFDDSKDSPSDRKRDLFDDRDVSSVVSESRGHRRKSSRYDDDDAKSVASSPGSSRRDKEHKERRTPEKRASNSVLSSLFKTRKDKKDSFLGNADTLGAGVGLASAATIIASDATRSNAADASSNQYHSVSRDGHRRARSYELVDPEVVSRVIKPAIDPQYGDLLPLPPSEPSSPVSGPEDLPPLPDSRPDTPPQERTMRRDMWSHQRRRSAFDTPIKSPSRTAVPIALRLGNRSNPGSPVSFKVSPGGSPIASHSDAVVMSRRAARPTSWDSTREIMPLYLLEHSRHQPTTGSVLPALPPSEPSETSAKNSPESEFLKHNDDYFGEELNFIGPDLRVDTQLSQQHEKDSDAGSEETTPRAEFMPVLPVPEHSQAADAPTEELDTSLPLPVESTSKVMDRDLYSPTPSPVDVAAMAVPAALAAAAVIRGKERADSPTERADDLESADEHFSDAFEGHSEPSSPGAYVFRALASSFDDRPSPRVQYGYEPITYPMAIPAQEPVVEEAVAREPAAKELVAEEPIVERSLVQEPPINSVTELLGLPAKEPAVNEPIIEEPTAEQAIAKEFTNDPVTERALVEEQPIDSVTELLGLPTEKANTEEPIVQEPNYYPATEPIVTPAEEPVVEEPAAEKSFVEEPPIDSVTELLGLPASKTTTEEPIVQEPTYYPATEPVTEPVDHPAQEPNVREPIVEEPIIEEPIIEEPIVEEPIVEEPAAERSFVEETPIDSVTELLGLPASTVKIEEPIVQEPTYYPATEPVAEPVAEPITTPAEEAADEKPAAAKSLIEESPVDSVTELLGLPTDEPTIQEPAIEQLTIEEPIVEEPTTKESPAEEPSVEPVTGLLGLPIESPTVKEPVVEEPVVEEPAVEESTHEEPSARSVTELLGIPAQEPAIESPEVEEPTTEGPTVEQRIDALEPTVQYGPQPFNESVVDKKVDDTYPVHHAPGNDSSFEQPVEESSRDFTGGSTAEDVVMPPIDSGLHPTQESATESIVNATPEVVEPVGELENGASREPASGLPETNRELNSAPVSEPMVEDVPAMEPTVETLSESAAENTRDNARQADTTLTTPAPETVVKPPPASATEAAPEPTSEVIEAAEAKPEGPVSQREENEITTEEWESMTSKDRKNMKKKLKKKGLEPIIKDSFDAPVLPQESSKAIETAQNEDNEDNSAKDQSPETTTVATGTESLVEPVPDHAPESLVEDSHVPKTIDVLEPVVSQEQQPAIMEPKEPSELVDEIFPAHQGPSTQQDAEGVREDPEITNTPVIAEPELDRTLPSSAEPQPDTENTSTTPLTMAEEIAEDPKESPSKSKKKKKKSKAQQQTEEEAAKAGPTVTETEDSAPAPTPEADKDAFAAWTEPDVIVETPAETPVEPLEAVAESGLDSATKSLPDAIAEPVVDADAFDAWAEPDAIVEAVDVPEETQHKPTAAPEPVPEVPVEPTQDDVTSPSKSKKKKKRKKGNKADDESAIDNTEIFRPEESAPAEKTQANEISPDLTRGLVEERPSTAPETKTESAKTAQLNKTQTPPPIMPPMNASTWRFGRGKSLPPVVAPEPDDGGIDDSPPSSPRPSSSNEGRNGSPSQRYFPSALRALPSTAGISAFKRMWGFQDQSKAENKPQQAKSDTTLPDTPTQADPVTAEKSGVTDVKSDVKSDAPDTSLSRDLVANDKLDAESAEKLETADVKPDTPATDLNQEIAVDDVARPKFDSFVSEPLFSQDSAPLEESQPEASQADEPQNNSDKLSRDIAEDQIVTEGQSGETNQDHATKALEPVLEQAVEESPLKITEDDASKSAESQNFQPTSEEAEKPIDVKPVQHTQESLVVAAADIESTPAEPKSEDVAKPHEVEPVQTVREEPGTITKDDVVNPTEGAPSENVEIDEAGSKKKAKKNKKKKKSQASQAESTEDQPKDMTKQDDIPQQPQADEPKLMSDRPTAEASVSTTGEQASRDHAEEFKPEDKLQTDNIIVGTEAKEPPAMDDKSVDESVIRDQPKTDATKELPQIDDKPTELEIKHQPQTDETKDQPKTDEKPVDGPEFKEHLQTDDKPVDELDLKEQPQTDKVNDQPEVNDKPVNESELEDQSKSDDKPAELETKDQPQLDDKPAETEIKDQTLADETREKAETDDIPANGPELEEQPTTDDKPTGTETMEQLRNDEELAEPQNGEPQVDPTPDQFKVDDKSMLEPEAMEQSQTDNELVKEPTSEESVQVSDGLTAKSPANDAVPEGVLDAERIAKEAREAEENATREAEVEAASETAEMESLLEKKSKRKGRLLKKDQARLTALEVNATRRAEERATREAVKQVAEQVAKATTADAAIPGSSEADNASEKPEEAQDKDVPQASEETNAERTSDTSAIPLLSNEGETQGVGQSTEGPVNSTPLPIAEQTPESHNTVDTAQPTEQQDAAVADEGVEPASSKKSKKKKKRKSVSFVEDGEAQDTATDNVEPPILAPEPQLLDQSTASTEAPVTEEASNVPTDDHTAKDVPPTDAKQTEGHPLDIPEEPVAESTPAESQPEETVDLVLNDAASEAPSEAPSEEPSEKKSKKKKKKKKNASASDEPETQPEADSQPQETPESALKKDAPEDVKDATPQETSPNASNAAESEGVESTEVPLSKDEAALPLQPETNTSHEPVLADEEQTQPADVNIRVETPPAQDSAPTVEGDKASSTAPDQPPAEDSLNIEDPDSPAKLSKKDKKKKKKAEKKKAAIEGTPDPESDLATPSQNAEALPKDEAADLPTETSKDTRDETPKQTDTNDTPNKDSNLEGKLATPADDAKAPDTGDSGKLPSEEPAGPEDERGGFSLSQSQTDQKNKAKDNDFEILQDPKTKHPTEPNPEPEKEDADVPAVDEAKSQGPSEGNEPEEDKTIAGGLEVPVKPEAKLEPGSELGEEKLEDNEEFAGLSKKQIKKLKKAKALAALNSPLEPSPPKEPESSNEETLEPTAEAGSEAGSKPETQSESAGIESPDKAVEELGPEVENETPSEIKEIVPIDEPNFEAESKSKTETQSPGGPDTQPATEPAAAEPEADVDVPTSQPGSQQQMTPDQDIIVPVPEVKSGDETHAPYEDSITNIAADHEIVEEDRADLPRQPPQEPLGVIQTPVVASEANPEHSVTDNTNVTEPVVENPSPHPLEEKEKIAELSEEREALEQDTILNPVAPVRPLEVSADVPVETMDKEISLETADGPEESLAQLPKHTAQPKTELEPEHPLQPVSDSHVHETPISLSDSADIIERKPQDAESSGSPHRSSSATIEQPTKLLESNDDSADPTEIVEPQQQAEAYPVLQPPSVSEVSSIPEPEVTVPFESVEALTPTATNVDEAIAGLSDVEQNKLNEDQKKEPSENVEQPEKSTQPVGGETPLDTAIVDDAMVPADRSMPEYKQEAVQEASPSITIVTDTDQGSAPEVIDGTRKDETAQSFKDKTNEPVSELLQEEPLSESTHFVAMPDIDVHVAKDSDGQVAESLDQVDEKKSVEDPPATKVEVPDTSKSINDSALPRLDDSEPSHVRDSASPVQPSSPVQPVPHPTVTDAAETKLSITPVHERAENEFTTEEWQDLSAKERKNIKKKLKKKDLDLVIKDSFEPMASANDDLPQIAPELVSATPQTKPTVIQETPENDGLITEEKKGLEPHDEPEVTVDQSTSVTDNQEREPNDSLLMPEPLSNIGYESEKQEAPQNNADLPAYDETKREQNSSKDAEGESSAPADVPTTTDARLASEDDQPTSQSQNEVSSSLPANEGALPESDVDTVATELIAESNAEPLPKHNPVPETTSQQPANESSPAKESKHLLLEPVPDTSYVPVTDARSAIDATPVQTSEDVEPPTERTLEPPVEASLKKSKKKKKSRKSSLVVTEDPELTGEATGSIKQETQMPSMEHAPEHRMKNESEDKDDTVMPPAPTAELQPSTEPLSTDMTEQPAPIIPLQESLQQQTDVDLTGMENINSSARTPAENNEAKVEQESAPVVEKARDVTFVETSPILEDVKSAEPAQPQQELIAEAEGPSPSMADAARQTNHESILTGQAGADKEIPIDVEPNSKDTNTVVEDEKEEKVELNDNTRDHAELESVPVPAELPEGQRSRANTVVEANDQQTVAEPAATEQPGLDASFSPERQPADLLPTPISHEDDVQEPVRQEPEKQADPVKSIDVIGVPAESSQPDTAAQVKDTASLPLSTKDKKKKKRKSKAADSLPAEPTEPAEPTSQPYRESSQTHDDKVTISPDDATAENSTQLVTPSTADVPEPSREIDQTRNSVPEAKQEDVQDNKGPFLDNSVADKEDNTIEEIPLSRDVTLAEGATTDMPPSGPLAASETFPSVRNESPSVVEAEVKTTDSPSLLQSSEPSLHIEETSPATVKSSKKDKKNKKKKQKHVDDDADASRDSQDGASSALPQVDQPVKGDSPVKQPIQLTEPVPETSEPDKSAPTVGEPGTSVHAVFEPVEEANSLVLAEEPKALGKEPDVIDREALDQTKDTPLSESGRLGEPLAADQTRELVQETQVDQGPPEQVDSGFKIRQPDILTPEPQSTKERETSDMADTVSPVPLADKEDHQSGGTQEIISKDDQPEPPAGTARDFAPPADSSATMDTDVPTSYKDVSPVTEVPRKASIGEPTTTNAPRHLASADDHATEVPTPSQAVFPAVGVLDSVIGQHTADPKTTSPETPTPDPQPSSTGQTTTPADDILAAKIAKRERKLARKLAKERAAAEKEAQEKHMVSVGQEPVLPPDNKSAQSAEPGKPVSQIQDAVQIPPTTAATEAPTEATKDDHVRELATKEPKKSKKSKRKPETSIPEPANEPDVQPVAKSRQSEPTSSKSTDPDLSRSQPTPVPMETSIKSEGQNYTGTEPDATATDKLSDDTSVPNARSGPPALEEKERRLPERVVNTPSSKEETKAVPSSSKPTKSIFAGFTAATAAWGSALFGDKKDVPETNDKKQDDGKKPERKGHPREGHGGHDGKTQTGEQNATTMSSHGIKPTVKDTGKDSPKESSTPRETKEAKPQGLNDDLPTDSNDHKDKGKGDASDLKEEAKMTEKKKKTSKKEKVVAPSADDTIFDVPQKSKDAEKKDKKPEVATAVRETPAKVERTRKEMSRVAQQETLDEVESPILGRGDLDLELSRGSPRPLLRRDSAVEEPRGGLLREDSKTFTPLMGTESDISDLRRSPSRLLEPVPEVPEAEVEPTRAATSAPKRTRDSDPVGDASSFQRRSRRMSEEAKRDSGLGRETPTSRRSKRSSPERSRDSGVHTEDWVEPERRPQSAIDRSALYSPEPPSERKLRRSPRGTPVLREPTAPETAPEPEKKKQYGALTPAGAAATAVTVGAGAGLAAALRAGGPGPEPSPFTSPTPITPTPRPRSNPNSNPASTSISGRRSASDNASPTRRPTPRLDAAGRRTVSNTSLSRRRTPEPLNFRPESPGINRASGTPTPPLRRVDRRMSSDLRAIRQQNTTAAPANSTPVANEGRARAKDMADVYDGFGEGRIGSPRSPTRPHSMRRRQSMQVLELENRVELLMAENRMLAEARAMTESNLSQRAANSLSERDSEIDKLRQSLQFLQHEVSRLTEVNEGLTSANAELANKDSGRVADLESRHAEVARELEETRRAKGSSEQTLEAKDAEIAELRAELDSAKEQIRDLQRQILESKANDDHFLNIRDEDHFDHRCQQLCSHVQQWVLRFSKFSDMRACRLTSEINDEKTIDRLDNAVLDGSDVDVYLRDRVKRRDIFMSMTMNMVWEFVFTRYLFGMDREQRQKLKSLEKLLTEVGPPEAVRQWRAVTLTLLAKRDSFKRQRDLDTEAVVQAIFQTLCKILPPPSNLEDQIQSQLRRVMREAVGLSIEMRTQKAEYMMLPPLRPEYDADGELTATVQFNASMMNERSGSITTSNEDLEAQGAIVRIVLFPLVVKKGDDNGKGDEEIVVCPAQVLVPRSKHLFGGASDGGSTSIGARSHISVVTETLGQTEVDYLDGGS